MNKAENQNNRTKIFGPSNKRKIATLENINIHDSHATHVSKINDLIAVVRRLLATQEHAEDFIAAESDTLNALKTQMYVEKASMENTVQRITDAVKKEITISHRIIYEYVKEQVEKDQSQIDKLTKKVDAIQAINYLQAEKNDGAVIQSVPQSNEITVNTTYVNMQDVHPNYRQVTIADNEHVEIVSNESQTDEPVIATEKVETQVTTKKISDMSVNEILAFIEPREKGISAAQMRAIKLMRFSKLADIAISHEREGAYIIQWNKLKQSFITTLQPSNESSHSLKMIKKSMGKKVKEVRVTPYSVNPKSKDHKRRCFIAVDKEYYETVTA